MIVQKLIMPFKKQMMLCGYKNARYFKHWGYAHYGIDVSSIQGGAGTDAHVYASGDGVVLAAGKDSRLGGAVAVLYYGALIRDTGETADLTARYMHLTSVSVKTGDKVKAGDVLGIEGREGTQDYHLHLEFDRDTAPQYATWSPQVAGSDFWKKGVDSTVNPSFVLHVGPGQEIAKPTYNEAWLNPEDLELGNWTAAPPDEKALRKEAEKERDFWKGEFQTLCSALEELIKQAKKRAETK